MNNAHLTSEKIKAIGNYALTGNELLAALEHIENCAVCRAKIALVTPEKIHQRLAVQETFQSSSTVSTKTQTAWQPAFGLAFAAIFLIGTVFGIFYLLPPFSGKTDLTAKNPPVDRANPINANNAPITHNENKTSVPEKTVNSAEESGKISPENIEKPVIPEPRNAETAKMKPQNQPLTKTETARKSVSKNSIDSSELKEKAADNNLQKFLTEIPAAVLSLKVATGAVRSNEAENLSIRPNGEVVRETQLLFTWKKAENAVGYQVSLTDNAFAEEHSEKVKNTSFKPAKPLQRNKVYFFTVTPEFSEDNEVQKPASKTAVFRVADEKTLRRIARAERIGDDRQTLSLMLNAGLLGEAEKKLTQMIKRNPKNGLYKKLLLNVKKMRQN